jgi:hypothetical protein
MSPLFCPLLNYIKHVPLIAATQKDGGISPDIVVTRIGLSEERERERELIMGRSVERCNAKRLASFWLSASEIFRFGGSIRQGQFSGLIP